MSERNSEPWWHIGRRLIAPVGSAAILGTVAFIASDAMEDDPTPQILEAPQAAAAEALGGSLRVATWNIRLGLRDDDSENYQQRTWQPNEDTITDVIRYVQPDILCMQEVTTAAANSLLYNLRGYHGILDLRDEEDSLDGVMASIKERVGTLTLVSSNLVAADNISAKRKRLFDRNKDGTPRSSQLAYFNDVLDVLNTHLSAHDIEENRVQAEETAAFANSNHGSDKLFITCGDINTTTNTRAGKVFLSITDRHSDCGPTFFSPDGWQRTVDYIGWNSADFLLQRCQIVPPGSLSDHGLLFVDLAAT